MRRVALRYVACEPWPSLAVEKEVKGGFVTAKQRSAFLTTKVVFTSYCLAGNSPDKIEYLPGMTVYVDAETARGHMWSKKIFKIGPEPVDGAPDERVSVIMIPENFIMMVDDPEDE